MNKKPLLSVTEVKRRLNELTKDEVTELLAETIKINKDARAFISVKLEGEKAITGLVKEYQDKIRNEFDPPRGDPKLRTANIKQAISYINIVGKGTLWPLELMIYFAETAAQYIHETGDISEDMGDYFNDTYEEIIQRLNKEKTPELYNKYKDRLRIILETQNCECWGIHDSLVGSYSVLRWVEGKRS